MSDLRRLLAKADTGYKRAVDEALKNAGEPIAAEAETRALTNVRNVHRSPQWAEMRVGVRPDLVYVVPVQRGVKRGNRRARRRFGETMLAEAMVPALEHQQGNVLVEVDRIFGQVAADFNSGG